MLICCGGMCLRNAPCQTKSAHHLNITCAHARKPQTTKWHEPDCTTHATPNSRGPRWWAEERRLEGSLCLRFRLWLLQPPPNAYAFAFAFAYAYAFAFACAYAFAFAYAYAYASAFAYAYAYAFAYAYAPQED